jgi:hypothetical protein
MQMQIVETNAGMAICSAPSRMAGSSALPCSRCQLMFSIATVASSTRMPTASARPPRVMMLIVSPSALSAMIELEDRERDRDRDDHRAAPAAEEHQDHQRGQRRGDDRLAEHALDRGADEHRLIGEQLDLQLGRQAGLDPRQRRLDPVDDVERRGVARLHHRQHRGALAVDPDDVGLRRVAVAHVRDVADVDRRAAHHLDRQVVQLLDAVRAAVQTHVVLEPADLRRAARQDQVLRRNRVDDVGRGQPLGLERLRVEVDHDLRLLAAVGLRDRRPWIVASCVRRKLTPRS